MNKRLGTRENDFYTRRPIRAFQDLDSIIQELKHDVPILQVVGRYVKLKKARKNSLHYIAKCPFHIENTPSLGVSPSRGIFHCWGCGAVGDIFSFVRRFENCNIYEAIDIIRNIGGITAKQKFGNMYHDDYFRLADIGDKYSQKALNVIYEEKEIKYSLLHGKNYKEITGSDFEISESIEKRSESKKPQKKKRSDGFDDTPTDVYKMKCEFIIKWNALYGNKISGLRHILKDFVDNLPRSNCPGGEIRGLEKKFSFIKSKYGDEVLCKMISLSYDKSGKFPEWGVAKEMIDAILEGNIEEFQNIMDFFNEDRTIYYHDWDKKRIIDGIKKSGIEDARRGVKLALEIHSDEDPRIAKGRVKRYVICACYLTYSRLEAFAREMQDVGLDAKEIFTLLFSVEDYEGNPGVIINIKKCVKELQKLDLDIKTFLSPLHSALYNSYPKSTIDDVREILGFMKKYNTPKIDSQNLRVAISYYRQPSKRSIVEALFKSGSVGSFTFACIAEAFSSLGAYGNGVDEAQKIFNEYGRQDALLRTHELMKDNYAKLGIFGFDKDNVEKLAFNPLFSANISDYKPIRSLGEIFDEAIRIFSKEKIIPFLKGIEPGTEIEFLMAIMEMKNFEMFSKMLSKIDKCHHLAFARSINRFGNEATMNAFMILNSSKLDFGRYLIPTASMIKNSKKGEISVFGMERFEKLEVATVDHERQFLAFLNLPHSIKRNTARAVDLYRRIFSSTLEKILDNPR